MTPIRQFSAFIVKETPKISSTCMCSHFQICFALGQCSSMCCIVSQSPHNLQNGDRTNPLVYRSLFPLIFRCNILYWNTWSHEILDIFLANLNLAGQSVIVTPCVCHEEYSDGSCLIDFIISHFIILGFFGLIIVLGVGFLLKFPF